MHCTKYSHVWTGNFKKHPFLTVVRLFFVGRCARSTKPTEEQNDTGSTTQPTKKRTVLSLSLSLSYLQKKKTFLIVDHTDVYLLATHLPQKQKQIRTIALENIRLILLARKKKKCSSSFPLFFAFFFVTQANQKIKHPHTNNAADPPQSLSRSRWRHEMPRNKQTLAEQKQSRTRDTRTHTRINTRPRQTFTFETHTAKLETERKETKLKTHRVLQACKERTHTHRDRERDTRTFENTSGKPKKTACCYSLAPPHNRTHTHILCHQDPQQAGKFFFVGLFFCIHDNKKTRFETR